MPYIKKEQRKKIDTGIADLSSAIINLNTESIAGSLNYTITKLVGEVYGPIEKLKYHDFNEIIGMLECCKLEFYRKQAAPYEDIKLKENGSVLGES